MIITGYEHQILRDIEAFLERRRVKYRDYWNLHQGNTEHEIKMGELIAILDTIDDIKKRYMSKK